jgi:hypothetical protein
MAIQNNHFVAKVHSAEDRLAQHECQSMMQQISKD